MFITYDKNTKRVFYIGEQKPISFTDNLSLAEANGVPEAYDYLTVANEHEQTDCYTEKDLIFNEETGEETEVEITKERKHISCDLVAQFRVKSDEQLVKEKQRKYEALVETLIRRKYTVSQELATLRQKEAKPDEYAAYFEYAENCKLTAKKEIYG
jgi:hypothetical protein